MEEEIKIKPKNEIERRIINSEEFNRAKTYGKVRSGHPEGSVGKHIQQMLEYIEEHYKDDIDYEKLRLLTLLHDIGKSEIRDKPHSESSAEIAKKFIDDKELIEIIRIHDQPYHFWRKTVKKKKPFDEIGFKKMFKWINWGLLVKFRYCDNCSRSQNPSIWFEEKCKELFDKSKKKHESFLLNNF